MEAHVTPPPDPADLTKRLLHRFDGTTLDMLVEVLTPLQVPIVSIDRDSVEKRGSAWSVLFVGGTGSENTHIVRGKTGKVVPLGSTVGEVPWRELIKARIHETREGECVGELHASKKTLLLERLDEIEESKVVLEIDRFGAAAKVESALTEAAFERQAAAEGFRAWRMPEDTAAHLGEYARFDFLLEDPSTGETRRAELKSLWGTDSSFARLISSKTRTNPTSSPRFVAQDVFAVNLWLRTGSVTDIAFAKSVSNAVDPDHGLPFAPKHPEHANQNPTCEIDEKVWFSSIRAVWELGPPP